MTWFDRIGRTALPAAAAVMLAGLCGSCSSGSLGKAQSSSSTLYAGGGDLPAAQQPRNRFGYTQPASFHVPPAPQPRFFPATDPADARGATAFPSDAPSTRAGAFILIDAKSGETLAFKNPDARRAVASTQKLLTALLVLERGGLDDTITIRREDTLAPPSKMYLTPGQRITRRELLTVFLVKSANDAAEALARDHSGSISAFAGAMNRKARQLGAYDSHFVNPHGLTESGQYSTARDVARIAYVAYQQPFVRSVAKMRSCRVQGRTYEATNKLLKRMPECTGLKTGYTNASGKCLVSTARVDGRDVLLVQLGSRSAYIWDDAAQLMRWGASQPRSAPEPWRTYAGATAAR